MTEMTINKLPSKTWYWLKVNETKLPWDFEHTTELPEENISVGQEETARFSITGEGEYSSKKINIHAAKGETTTVFMDYAPVLKSIVPRKIFFAPSRKAPATLISLSVCFPK